MLRIAPSGRFKRDVKRTVRRGKDLAKLTTGDWAGYRDLHIEPDWLLIYRVKDDELQLARTGTHSDLFDE
jgi:mRNA interferase YafQ